MNEDVGPGQAKLHRFNVAHGPCGGVTFSEPTEADIDFGSGRIWVNGRCNGCGATIRESQDAEAMIRDITALAEAAGINAADLRRALQSGDSAAIDEMSDKIQAAPATLRACLAAIRKAMTDETQN